jgi:hypothetical protein
MQSKQAVMRSFPLHQPQLGAVPGDNRISGGQTETFKGGKTETRLHGIKGEKHLPSGSSWPVLNFGSAIRRAGSMTPEQRAIVEAVIERAEQACRHVLRHNEDAWRGDKRTAYHEGFEVACEICERAIRTHVMTHIQGDIVTRKDE